MIHRTKKDGVIMNSSSQKENFSKWISLSTSASVLVSFCFAIIALPKSGANCTISCVQYPYLNIQNFFPNDYYWMPLASLAMMVYLMLFTSIYHSTSDNKKVFSHIGLNFSILSSLILILNYLVQFLVVQASLNNSETEGIALLTQYNPHGLFIALETIGYLLMTVSFIFIIPSLDNDTKEEKWTRIVLLVSVFLTTISLIFFYSLFGLNIEDRFEVVIISVNWSTLIIIGFLYYKIFKNNETGRIYHDN